MNPNGSGTIGEIVRQRVNVLATVLLAVGLVVAIAMDGQLPAPITKGLFVALMGLDLVMIRWLVNINNA